VVINFGKHSGLPLRDVPKQYLEWLLTADFSEPFKAVVLRTMNGDHPIKE
jgi:uncharacterized protein (DUF3820 family)